VSFNDLKPPTKEDIQKIQKQNDQHNAERFARFHRVFVQNKEGAKILEEWVNTYCFGSFTTNDASVTELAKAEARREFVSMIISQINRSENQ